MSPDPHHSRSDLFLHPLSNMPLCVSLTQSVMSFYWLKFSPSAGLTPEDLWIPDQSPLVGQWPNSRTLFWDFTSRSLSYNEFPRERSWVETFCVLFGEWFFFSRIETFISQGSCKSLCSSGWHDPCNYPPASASQGLRLQEWATPWFAALETWSLLWVALRRVGDKESKISMWVGVVGGKANWRQGPA